MWLTDELVFVAKTWHLAPDVWLRQDNRVRRSMLKHARLAGDAMLARQKARDRQAKRGRG